MVACADGLKEKPFFCLPAGGMVMRVVCVVVLVVVGGGGEDCGVGVAGVDMSK